MKKNKTSVFEQMIQDILNAPLGEQMLEECMSANTAVMRKVPLRYRLIALAFIRGESLEELNEKLAAEGCARLYSRSFWEASLIFAFLHGLSYDRWKELQELCRSLRDSCPPGEKYFDGQITLKELKRYLDDNSRKEDQQLYTKHLTRTLENKIACLDSGKEDFQQFLNTNIQSFSPVREKSRYYFCKYLYYYLEGKMRQYLDGLGDSSGEQDGLAELAVFKGVTQLKRKKRTREETEEFLREAGISCREIFDDFNYFYFGYVSLDWLEVLMEYYGDVEKLPEDRKGRLAESLRHYYPKLKHLNNEEVLNWQIEKNRREEEELDKIYSLDSRDRGYQRNRSGENTVRKYIKGTLDLDRTAFICFLVFFGKALGSLSSLSITEERLDEILLECGFSKLVKKHAFDDFILRYLESDDPADLLMEEVTRYAQNEENFFFYNVYKDSRNYQQEYRKIMGVD
ncbi:MAG: hypothetical protein ACOX8E_07445 [Ruminococcus sp.]|jgi:hypothetical protein